MKNKIVKIKIGSKNPIKIAALKEVLFEYSCFNKFKIISMKSDSMVRNQPRSLKETVEGAINRAKNIYANCDYSFGLEAGLIRVPYTDSGYMDICVCAIFNGKRHFLGLSPAWEVPKQIVDCIINYDVDMNEAARRAGLTKNKKVGYKEGLIGLLTEGKITRKEYTKEAIKMALVCLLNSTK